MSWRLSYDVKLVEVPKSVRIALQAVSLGGGLVIIGAICLITFEGKEDIAFYVSFKWIFAGIIVFIMPFFMLDSLIRIKRSLQNYAGTRINFMSMILAFTATTSFLWSLATEFFSIAFLMKPHFHTIYLFFLTQYILYGTSLTMIFLVFRGVAKESRRILKLNQAQNYT